MHSAKEFQQGRRSGLTHRCRRGRSRIRFPGRSFCYRCDVYTKLCRTGANSIDPDHTFRRSTATKTKI